MTLTYHPSWGEMLDKAKDSDYFRQTFAILSQQDVLPADQSLWFKPLQVDLTKVKVVILGDEPISMNGSSNGLAWGIHPNSPVPNATKGIYREMRRTIAVDRESFDRTMHSLFLQNVLLLNTSPTVEKSKPGSHQDLWRRFTSNLILRISERATLGEPIHWFIWGKYAKNMVQSIVDHEVIPNSSYENINAMNPNIVFMAGHPEADMIQENREFLGCNHFHILRNLIHI